MTIRGTSQGLLLLFLLAPTVVPAERQAASEPARTTQPELQAADAAELDLEQLANMDVIVTSASKKEESLAGAPAAIYVITQDDIRRSGLSSLPELLRMVPGITVQHGNAHAWTVSARGFNGFPNEKMLVLIDGRAIYDPLYGGVYWDEQDLRLQDIERIEVIRGPGGALWGANAVNGVINVITMNARHTQGVALATSLGQDEGYSGSARLGSQAGQRFFYRIYGQSSYWDPFVEPSGAEMYNGWNITSGGFRGDWEASDKDTLTLDGAGYAGHVRDTAMVATYTTNATVLDPYSIQGGHFLGRWKRTFSGRSATELSIYCDWRNRTEIEYGGEFRKTCDLDFQHDYQVSRRHSLIWGGGFRSTDDQTRVSFRNHFTPPDRRLNLFSGFGQYDLALLPDRLRVILGTKFENHTYTGFNVQPQIRAVWTPARSQTVWGAVSRSVRTPTRNEHDNFLTYMSLPQGPPPTPPIILSFVGNPGIQPEQQTAYELGYRYQDGRRFSLDAVIFYNSYRNLIYPDMTRLINYFNPNPPYVVSAMRFTNLSTAQTHGLELGAAWQPLERWSLSLGVTEDRGTGISMYATPRHLFTASSRVDLSKRIEFNAALYHSNAILVLGPINTPVPTSNRVDCGMGWQVAHGLHVGLWGRNLQSDQHREGRASFISGGEVRRAVVLKLDWELPVEGKSSVTKPVRSTR